MTPIISIDCTCGRQIRATDPLPGQSMRCIYCGATEVYKDADGGEPSSTAPLPFPDINLTGEVELTCPGCGGTMAPVWKARNDKVAECEYCGTIIDLPEKRGFTHERISRGNGSHTVERVSQYFVELGGDDNPEPTIDPEDIEGAAIDYFGETFGSFGELEEMLSTKLSPEQASRIMAELKASIKG